MAVELILPTMVSSDEASASASGNSSQAPGPSSETTTLFDGELSADELNEIPALPPMDGTDAYDALDPEVVECFLDENHPATNIALTASAIDGALGTFSFLPIEPLATSSTSSVPQEVPILPAVVPDASEKATSKGKKRSPAKKVEGASKKRRVSKSTSKVTEAPAQGSPTTSPKLAPLPPPAVLVSPSTSVASFSDRKMTVTPTLDSSAPAALPLLPNCGAAAAQPLLPQPTASSVSPPLSASTTTPPSQEASTVAAPPEAPTPTPASPKRTEPSTSPDPEYTSSGPANITTDHILMLTGENGPAECAKNIVTATPNAVDGRRCNRSHMTQEQRAQASRDRNREHARNTRLRKKAYVEELKKTLLALVEQRDAKVAQAEHKDRLEKENKNVRFSVMEEFLRLRGGNMKEVNRWAAILMPDFTLRLPTINVQGLVEEKSLTGVDQVMDDSNAFSDFLQTLGSGGNNESVALNFDASKTSFFMDGKNALLEWEASTVGAVAKGAKSELHFHGNMKAQFDPESNRMISASFLFDSGFVLYQKKSNAASI